jgi:hypothetical protein
LSEAEGKLSEVQGELVASKVKGESSSEVEGEPSEAEGESSEVNCKLSEAEGDSSEVDCEPSIDGETGLGGWIWVCCHDFLEGCSSFKQSS